MESVEDFPKESMSNDMEYKSCITFMKEPPVKFLKKSMKEFLSKILEEFLKDSVEDFQNKFLKKFQANFSFCDFLKELFNLFLKQAVDDVLKKFLYGGIPEGTHARFPIEILGEILGGPCRGKSEKKSKRELSSPSKLFERNPRKILLGNT